MTEQIEIVVTYEITYTSEAARQHAIDAAINGCSSVYGAGIGGSYSAKRIDAVSIQRHIRNIEAKRDALRSLLLDMRQHQGSIQPYIKRIDAALRGEGE